ncbi:putative ankyrin repeat protein RF_0381 [Microplitis mediator]|uniref:putative ankyrin repeat protein RF_0381 n=1 Tax=Microplitis mediator TaxID=375433 RepID=UPI002556957A|nr:putative ankyrin repeat protein RF_0381 [Microplitis mediator]
MVKLLLNRGADANAHCLDRGDGYTALHYAVMNDNIVVIDLVLKRGANINVKSSDGKAILLHLAIETGTEAIVRCLLDAGADINIRRNTDCYQDLTPVIEAFSRERRFTVSLLIEYGADLSAMAMATYAKNKRIEKAMTLPKLNSKFPLYAHMLMELVDKARKRNQLLKKVCENLEDVSINLPYNCSEIDHNMAEVPA